MKKILTLVVLLFAIFQPTGASAQEKDIPKLQNPFSVSYVKKNLKQSKPRMIYNEKIVELYNGLAPESSYTEQQDSDNYFLAKHKDYIGEFQETW